MPWRQVLTSTGTAVTNWLARTRAGIRIGTVADLGRALIRPGFTVSSRGDLRSRVHAGMRVITSVAGDSVRRLAPALAVRSLVSLLSPQRPAVRVTQDRIILQAVWPANAVQQVAMGGRSDWTNITNATGKPNGTVSTLTSNALGNRGGALQLDHQNAVGKASLSITSAEVRYYYRQEGTVLDNGNLTLQYDKGGPQTTVVTEKGNVDFLTSPRVVPLPAGYLASWADVDAFRATVIATYGLVAGIVDSLDAVELVVNAERIENV